MIKHLTRAVVFGAVLGFVPAAWAQVDVTAPGDPVVALHNTIAGGNNSVSTNGGTGPFGPGMYPGGEAPARAIDNITLVPPTGSSKYLNFGNGGNSATAGANTGIYVTPSLASIVTGLRFATANDSPARDPLTYTLEGTNGDPSLPGVWTLISSGDTGLQTDPGRNVFQSLASAPLFTNTSSYTSYRLLFPTHRASANSMQIGEIEFLGVAIPEPSTFALGGVGLVGVIVALRRRRRQV